MAKQLFGTDGIRGTAGAFPLDPATVHAFGMALGSVASALASSPQVLIGMDTRESSPWIAAQVAGGLARRGVRATSAGVITTPGVAYLTKTDEFVAGVMISASHNPFADNGIKVFGHSGYKLPDDEEHEIEEAMFKLLEKGVDPQPLGIPADEGLDREYVDHLLSTLPVSLGGLRVAADCGNGAASELAPGLLRRAGAEVIATHRAPNGRNINLNCGALHIESVRETVLAEGADMGVAFDGDGDRAIFVARSGKVVDGDAVMLMVSRALRAAGKLPGNTVVATVMSNLGLEKALAGDGVRMLRTPVGDKYVLEEMLRSGAALGGEQSGHVIFSEHATTGDGMLTALRVFEIARRSGLGLDELSSDLTVYPQRLVNVRVREKKPLAEMPSVAREVKACEEALAGLGRVLVRFSGTEALARVMVEGPELAQVNEFTERIAGAIQREIG
ncbi:MAG: phosphoglucosamine mutase [Bryobacteraceae bacterium]